MPYMQLEEPLSKQRHPVRASEELFENGEKVFYKRDDGKRWHGPDKVVGQLVTVVFVTHGSRLIRCTSSCDKSSTLQC